METAELFRQKEDSFQLLWLLLQLDSTYRTTPSKVLFMMEELYEKGCTSPLLYIEAWKMISEDVSLLHRLTRSGCRYSAMLVNMICLPKNL